VRPQTAAHPDYRGYAGTLLSGSLKKGDKVKLYPLEAESSIKSIEKHQVQVDEIHKGEPGVLHLNDNYDIGRGCMIVGNDDSIKFEKSIEARICWMDNKPYHTGQHLILQSNSFTSKAIIKTIDADIDIHTLDKRANEGSIVLNGICDVSIKLADAICYEPYKLNRKAGSFILINENTNNTVAAGIIKL
jgi:sulfate adenylyltransferase subunit 1